MQAHPSNLQLGKPIPADHDGLHVDHRAAIPDGFDAELVELPKASCLGPVIPEIRTGVEEPYRLRFLVEPGVEVRPHDGGGSLRPQRQRPTAAIGEGIHLFGDDVTTLAGAALEEFGRLKDRGLDALITEAPRLVFRRPLHRIPVGLVRGQQILGAARPLRDGSHGVEA